MENFSGYEIIKYDQMPQTYQWALTPLYKINQKGAKMYWQIGFNQGKLISLTGIVENAKGQRGKIRMSTMDVKLNKSGRDLYEQALLEARSKYHKKYQKNFRPEGEMENLFLQPQLANEYQRPIDYTTGYGSNLTLRHLQRGIAVQVKVDGIRARSWFFPGQIPEQHFITLLSRNNNEFDSPVHIKDELKSFFVFLYTEIINNGYNPYGYDSQGKYDAKLQWGIDGEFYNHNIGFEEIGSIIRSEKTIHPRINEMQYYMFDLIIPGLPSDDRTRILEETYKKYVVSPYYRGHLVLLTTTVVHSYAEIDQLLSDFVSAGYEGVILRKRLGIPMNQLTQKEIEETYYKPERNDNLLKYKLTQTEEGVVVDIVPGEGKDADLAQIVIRDVRGNILKVHPSGPDEIRREWLANKQRYIGLPYTFKFKELTPYGVPREPVGVAFRTYE